MGASGALPAAGLQVSALTPLRGRGGTPTLKRDPGGTLPPPTLSAFKSLLEPAARDSPRSSHSWSPGPTPPTPNTWASCQTGAARGPVRPGGRGPEQTPWVTPDGYTQRSAARGAASRCPSQRPRVTPEPPLTRAPRAAPTRGTRFRGQPALATPQVRTGGQDMHAILPPASLPAMSECPLPRRVTGARGGRKGGAERV